MHPRLQTLLARYPQLQPCQSDIERAAEALCRTFAAGGKLLLCGNGGSSADADHISGELLKGFGHPRPLSDALQKKLGPELGPKLQAGLPAIPLTAFSALSSAFINDCDPLMTYAQLTLALGRPGDVLLGISTSGNARNVLYAMQTAQTSDLRTIGLTGRSGGKLKDATEICIRVPEDEVYKIQELHLPLYHCLCFMVEDHFFANLPCCTDIPTAWQA